jgi:hypothetical protein
LAAPLLTLGLERAVTMSEALESRGFGGPEGPVARSRFGPIVLAASLTLVAVAAFLFATGDMLAALPVLVTGVFAGWMSFRSAHAGTVWRPSRYRPVVFRSSDRWLTIACLTAFAAILASYRMDPGSLVYEPYPEINWPTVSFPVIAAIGLLLALLLAPVERTRGGR